MWILLSLGASLFWGLEYVLNEQVYKKISVLTSLTITSFFVFILALIISFFSGNLNKDIHTIVSSKELLWLVVGEIVFLLIAELFIGFSITAKDATLAGLIEISYPIFIAIFSYILYKNHISWQTIIGGLFIFVGIFIIYFFNK